MRILIATTQVPFVRGGAEVHAEELLKALRAEGHEAEIVAIPFKWYPPERILDQMLACRLMDLTDSSGTKIDRIIGLKFPAYLIPHPNKVLWILHQHRSAYDLWDHELGDLINYPNGIQIRDAIRHADSQLIPEARAIFTNSNNVSRRLKTFNGIDSTPLYHPPQRAEQYYCADAEDYLFFPSRLNPTKRQALALEALAETKQRVRLLLAGSTDSPAYADQLKSMAKNLGVSNRVEWLGHIDDEKKRQLYARSSAVLFPPIDEDYGYITLEAMLSSKPVITCTDSGGPLEFVLTEKTGLIVEPTAQAMAAALDQIWENRDRAKQMGREGKDRYKSMGISWPKVVKKLLS